MNTIMNSVTNSATDGTTNRKPMCMTNREPLVPSARRGPAVPGLLLLLLVVVAVAASAFGRAGAAEPPQGDGLLWFDVPRLALALPDPERLPPDLRAIRERGYLIVAMADQDRYPFYYVDKDGELTGLEVDIALDMAAQLGVDVLFDRSSPSFNAVVDFVADGHADVAMTKLSLTLQRAQQVRFTTPYIRLQQMLLFNRAALAAARAGSDALTVLRLPGQRVGVAAGTSFVEYALQLFPEAELVLYDDLDALFDAVLRGEVVATLYDQAQTSGLLHQRPELRIFLDEQPVAGLMDALAFAVPWESAPLQQWINTYLEVRDERWRVQDLFDLYEPPKR